MFNRLGALGSLVLLCLMLVAAPTAAAPSMSLSNSDSVDPVAAGGPLDYVLGFTNSGADDATSVQIIDVLSSNTTYTSAVCTPSGSCMHAAGVVTCAIGTVGAGSGGSCTIGVTVKQPLVNGTLLANTANLTDGEGDDVFAGQITTVTSTPALTLGNTDGVDPAPAGDNLEYTVTLQNTGNANATGVVITMTLDPNLTFASGACGALACSSGVGNTAVCNVPTVAIGTTATCRITSAVAFPLADGTMLQSCADATDNEGVVPAQACADTEVRSTTLSLGLSDGTGPVVPGGRINVRLRYANRGIDDANSVVLTYAVPGGTTVASVTDGGVTAAGVVTWTLGTVPAGQSGILDVVLAVEGALVPPAMLAHDATIGDDAGDLTQVSEPTRVVAAPVLGIGISDGPDPVTPGDDITALVKVSNPSGADLSSVTVTIPDPSRTTFQSATFPNASGGGTSSCSYSLSTRTTTCSLGQVKKGEERVVTYVTRTDAGLPLASLATIRATASGGGGSAEGSSHTLVDSGGALTITKAADASPVQAVTPITYTLDYTTTGSDQLVITDPVPADAVLVSASCDAGSCACDTATCDSSARIVTCLVPAPPPASGSCTIVVVPSTVPHGTEVGNRAQLESAGRSAEGTEVTLVQATQPLTSLMVSDYPDPVPVKDRGNPGRLTYTIHVENPGNQRIAAVTVRTKTPKGLFVSASGPVDAEASRPNPLAPGSPARRVVWNLGDLDPGAKVDLTLVMDLNARARVGRTIRNRVIMRGTGFADLVVLITTVGPAK